MGFIFGLFFGIILGLLYREFFICKHNWIFIESGNIETRHGKVGIYETYKCTKCKKFKDETSC
jgi:hypothetical protein